jgi:hypothetical protein
MLCKDQNLPVDQDEKSPAPPSPEPESKPESSEPKKRNSGRTGPTSIAGKAIAAQNAVRHGMCSRTLVLKSEFQQEWENLLASLRRVYGEPAEDSVLAEFIYKTAHAEWVRRRAQREYDRFLANHDDLECPMYAWPPEVKKDHELAMRYKTAAERAFQREYRLLEQHYKTHHANAEPAKAKSSKTEESTKPKPEPPGFVIKRMPPGKKIIPGAPIYPKDTQFPFARE